MKIHKLRSSNLLFFSLFILAGCSTVLIQKPSATIPKEFAYLKEKNPTIIEEMRYMEDHNFIGYPISGYNSPRCILTTQAADALSAVQTELQEYSMTLKVYDCYRPQRAVDSFVAWAKDATDNKMKKEFYPNVEKTNLFKDGYIFEKSGHSRGSTVDLTVVALPIEKQPKYHDGDALSSCFLSKEKRFQDNSLDFGTGFDCFDPLAHTANPNISSIQKQRRVMLKSVMEKHGFKNLAEEWWHYTLKDEPFPNKYFDFEVK